MATLQKLLYKFYKNPTALKYSDIEKILIYLGCIKIFSKGSHVKFKHPLIKFDLIIPVHNNDCNKFYKKAALKFVKIII